MENEKQARIRREQEFFAKCAELLNLEHEYHVPYRRKTRWNARTLSNGRFPGFGTVQDFGGFFRIMCKKGTFSFQSKEEVFAFLESY